MEKLYKSIFEFIVFNIVLSWFSIVNVCAENDQKDITILINKIDLPDEVVDSTKWEERYSQLINQHFHDINRQSGNKKLLNYNINFEFFSYEVDLNDKYYGHLDYLTNLMNLWISNDSNKTYDLLIFDDRFLYSEAYYMETDWCFFYLNSRQPSVDYLTNLFDYVNLDNLTFHHPRIMEDSFREGRKTNLYGLPFEMDFNVLYYDQQNPEIKPVIDDLQNLTWDDLLQKLPPSDSLKMALADGDYLINLFSEYTNNYYNLTKEFDHDFYKIFYNQTAQNLFTSFRNFLINSLGDEDHLKNSIYQFHNETYLDFLNNETSFFKGKASHAPFFTPGLNPKINKTVSMTLPPKYMTAITEKFLVVNKFSPHDKSILAEIALQLTSKDMQLFKSKHFGSIPTFDFDQKNVDPDIQSYCQDHPELCHMMENMNRIYIKDFFKSKYSSPLMEIEILLPRTMRIDLLLNNDIDTIKFKFKNMHELITYNLGISCILSYLFLSLVAILLLIIIFLIYRYKNHPYIKVISPPFCNMIIFGCILGMIGPLRYLPPYSHLKIKIFYVIKYLGNSLIYVPMYAITYRIYSLYKSKTAITAVISNSILYYNIFFLIFLNTTYNIVICILFDALYMPFGSINQPRFPDSFNTAHDFINDNNVYDFANHVYFYFLFTALLFMMLTTGNVSNNFGDISFIFVVFGLNIVNFIVERLLQKLSHEHYSLFFILIMIFNGLSYFYCVYFLVGSRVLFILLNPLQFEKKNISEEYLQSFVPLKYNDKKFSRFINKVKSVVGLINIDNTDIPASELDESLDMKTDLENKNYDNEFESTFNSVK